MWGACSCRLIIPCWLLWLIAIGYKWNKYPMYLKQSLIGSRWRLNQGPFDLKSSALPPELLCFSTRKHYLYVVLIARGNPLKCKPHLHPFSRSLSQPFNYNYCLSSFIQLLPIFNINQKTTFQYYGKPVLTQSVWMLLFVDFWGLNFLDLYKKVFLN